MFAAAVATPPLPRFYVARRAMKRGVDVAGLDDVYLSVVHKRGFTFDFGGGAGAGAGAGIDAGDTDGDMGLTAAAWLPVASIGPGSSGGVAFTGPGVPTGLTASADAGGADGDLGAGPGKSTIVAAVVGTAKASQDKKVPNVDLGSGFPVFRAPAALYSETTDTHLITPPDWNRYVAKAIVAAVAAVKGTHNGEHLTSILEASLAKAAESFFPEAGIVTAGATVAEKRNKVVAAAINAVYDETLSLLSARSKLTAMINPAELYADPSTRDIFVGIARNLSNTKPTNKTTGTWDKFRDAYPDILDLIKLPSATDATVATELTAFVDSSPSMFTDANLEAAFDFNLAKLSDLIIDSQYFGKDERLANPVVGIDAPKTVGTLDANLGRLLLFQGTLNAIKSMSKLVSAMTILAHLPADFVFDHAGAGFTDKSTEEAFNSDAQAAMKTLVLTAVGFLERAGLTMLPNEKRAFGGESLAQDGLAACLRHKEFKARLFSASREAGNDDPESLDLDANLKFADRGLIALFMDDVIVARVGMPAEFSTDILREVDADTRNLVTVGALRDFARKVPVIQGMCQQFGIGARKHEEEQQLRKNLQEEVTELRTQVDAAEGVKTRAEEAEGRAKGAFLAAVNAGLARLDPPKRLPGSDSKDADGNDLGDASPEQIDAAKGPLASEAVGLEWRSATRDANATRREFEGLKNVMENKGVELAHVQEAMGLHLEQLQDLVAKLVDAFADAVTILTARLCTPWETGVFSGFFSVQTGLDVLGTPPSVFENLNSALVSLSKALIRCFGSLRRSPLTFDFTDPDKMSGTEKSRTNQKVFADSTEVLVDESVRVHVQAAWIRFLQVQSSFVLNGKETLFGSSALNAFAGASEFLEDARADIIENCEEALQYIVSAKKAVEVVPAKDKRAWFTDPAKRKEAHANFWNIRAVDDAVEDEEVYKFWGEVAAKLNAQKANGQKLAASSCVGFPMDSSWVVPPRGQPTEGGMLRRGHVQVPCQWGGVLPDGVRVGYTLTPLSPADIDWTRLWTRTMGVSDAIDSTATLGITAQCLNNFARRLKAFIERKVEAQSGDMEALATAASSSHDKTLVFLRDVMTPSGRGMSRALIEDRVLLPPMFRVAISGVEVGDGNSMPAHVFWVGVTEHRSEFTADVDAESLQVSKKEATDLIMYNHPEDGTSPFASLVTGHSTTGVLLNV
jgi:hypothetical protein